MSQDSKLEQQSQIHKAIVAALIDSTPEHWYSFTLRVENNGTNLIHSISSSENHTEIITPSEAVFQATRTLQQYQDAIAEPINVASFQVSLDANDNWHYEADFDYKA